MPEQTHIAIIGAGALGCLFGAGLCEAGYQLTLVTRRQQAAAALTRNGIRLEEATGQRIVSSFTATTDYAAVRRASLVLVLVKASATADAARSLRPHLAPDALVLTLQNGLGNIETLCAALPPEQVAAGTTGNGAVALDVGHIRLGGIGETVIGELNGSRSARIAAICRMLAGAGFPTRVSDDITGAIWTKLMANVGINPVSALTGLPNGAIVGNADTFDIARKAVLEAAAVAFAAGIRLETDDPVEHMRRVGHLTAHNETSMLQDIRAGRPTEIDAMNGEIVRRGLALSIPVPVNTVLAALVRSRGRQPGA